MPKIVSILTLAAILMSCSHDVPFDSEKWKNAPVKGPEWSLRWDMSGDLMENYDLKGKDTTQGFKLLGRESYNCFGDKCIVRYTLGPCRRGISYGTLELTFNKGKVVRIFRHCG